VMTFDLLHFRLFNSIHPRAINSLVDSNIDEYFPYFVSECKREELLDYFSAMGESLLECMKDEMIYET